MAGLFLAQGLSPLLFTAEFTQGTDLEHVGIVPALFQSRMTENKTKRLSIIKQTLLVFHDQFVDFRVACGGAAGVFQLHHLAPLLHLGEIAIMYLLHLPFGQVAE